MKRDTGVRFAVALLAIVSLGVSATTLESTLSTDANDVIDLNYDQVPLGQDDASALVDEIQGRNGDERVQQQTGNGDERMEPGSREGDGQASGSTSGEESAAQQAEEVMEGTTPTERSLLDRLLELLPLLIGFVLAGAALGLAIRYRDRLLAYFRDPEPAEPTESHPEPVDDWHGKEPTNAVEQTWVEMVTRLDLDRPGAKTPEECARAAIRAGFDRDAVQSLTAAFVEVRYGTRPVDEHREQVATQSRRQLGVGGDS